MWPDRVSNPVPLTYESVVLPIALRDPAKEAGTKINIYDWVILLLYIDRALFQ